MNIYQFMGEHPILTFFLALFLGETLCTVAKAIGGRYRRCPRCHQKKEEKP